MSLLQAALSACTRRMRCLQVRQENKHPICLCQGTYNSAVQEAYSHADTSSSALRCGMMAHRKCGFCVTPQQQQRVVLLSLAFGVRVQCVVVHQCFISAHASLALSREFIVASLHRHIREAARKFRMPTCVRASSRPLMDATDTKRNLTCFHTTQTTHAREHTSSRTKPETCKYTLYYTHILI